MNKISTEHRQKAPSVFGSVFNVEHKWAFTLTGDGSSFIKLAVNLVTPSHRYNKDNDAIFKLRMKSDSSVSVIFNQNVNIKKISQKWEGLKSLKLV